MECDSIDESSTVAFWLIVLFLVFKSTDTFSQSISSLYSKREGTEAGDTCSCTRTLAVPFLGALLLGFGVLISVWLLRSSALPEFHGYRPVGIEPCSHSTNSVNTTFSWCFLAVVLVDTCILLFFILWDKAPDEPP